MTNELHPGEVLTAETVGPYTCMKCTAETWNDDDVCDVCRAEDARENARLSASDEGRGSLPAAPFVPTEGEGAAERYFLACGDHRDTHYAVHGPLGHIASGLPPEAAASIVNHLNQLTTHPQEAASVPGEGGEPVAWQWRYGDIVDWYIRADRPDWFDDERDNPRFYSRPLYTHPAREDGPAGQWQDIATAPKDGTRFLAYGGGLDDEVETCSWSGQTACWNLESFTADDRDDEPQGYCRPTHWMPLPAKPTKEPA